MQSQASLLVALVATAFAAIGPASAEDMPDGVRQLAWTPPLDMSPEDARSVSDRCLNTAWQAHQSVVTNVEVPYNVADGSAGVGGVIGYALVAGITQNMAEERAYNGTLAYCFYDAGFIQIGLTGREVRLWIRAAAPFQRRAYTTELLRADPARAITPPILPERPGPVAAVRKGEAFDATVPPAGEETAIEEAASDATVTEASETVLAEPAAPEPAVVEDAAVAADPVAAEP